MRTQVSRNVTKDEEADTPKVKFWGLECSQWKAQLPMVGQEARCVRAQISRDCRVQEVVEQI